MKSLRVSLLFILSAIFLVIAGCEKDYLQMSEQEPAQVLNNLDAQQREYNPEANILNFASSIEFISTINEIKEMEERDIKNLSKLKEFYSLNDYNLSENDKSLAKLRGSGTDKDGEFGEINDEDEIVFDSKLAALLNENREIVIEGVTYRITKEGLFAYKNTPNSDLDSFLKSYNSEEVKGLQDGFVKVGENVAFFPQDVFYDPIEKSSEQKARVVCTSSGAGFFGHNHTCVDQYSGNYRVKGRTYSQSFGIFASIGTSTRHQKKRFGIWTSDNANYISRQANTLEVEFVEPNNTIITVDLATFPVVNFESNSNDNKVKWSGDFQTGVFTTKFPFLKKPAKARKIKKHDTIHIATDNGATGEVQLKYN